ncbi:MAG TPA: NB-ARC domain-containing protein [Ktedonobacteraceae bacterium]
MTSEAYPHSASNLDLFRQKVVAALRQAGRLQREMAHALGINPQVFSRKLHGFKQTVLTHTEVKQIIKTLAAWDAITTQTEAIELLALMGLKIESFSEQEWNMAPLKHLEGASHTSTRSPLTPPSTSSLSALPASSTSLLGREHHMQMLLDRLRQVSIRLLTLLGTGGVGKTRLALEVAHAARHNFADGVFFVSLATLRDAALVPSTIIAVLHLKNPVAREEPGRQTIASQEDLLKAFLRDKEILLVLDNVEQIPTIAPFIGDLLSSAPSLKIMVTSRAVLHLYGEQQFDVPSLDFCIPDQATDLHTVSQLSAIRLFVERAQAINLSFQITEQNATTITHICARLDGLPLAIELAAARTKMLPLSLILQRLTDRTGQSLTFLHSRAHNIPQRHQTLHETLDWSYELLTPQQQRFFRRLSVFVGGWTAQAALTIGMAEDQAATLDDVLELTEALIDHSLVKRVQPTADLLEPHFYFLETIREYALGRLAGDEEDEDTQRRHATHYLALVEATEADLANHNQVAAAALLMHEQDNLRAALTWSINHDEAEITQRMCGALGKFWEARAQFQEAHLWIDTALKITRETAPAIRAKLLMAASRLVLWEIACEHSRVLAQEALALYEAIDDIEGKTYAIFQIGDTWHMQGEYTLATRYLEESLHLLHKQKDWGTYAFALSRLGAIALLQGNFSQAWTQLQEALPLLRTYSEPGLLNITLVYLGTLALVQGDMGQSITYLREGLLLAQQINNHYMLATTLIVLGCLLGTSQGPSYAAHICSAAEALFTSLNTALPTAYQPLYNAYLDGLKSQVDEAQWQTWWAEGKALSPEEVSTLALEAK